jgi:hypothetical protein
MLYRSLSFLNILLLCSLVSIAQNNASVSGTIVNRNNQLPLAEITVQLLPADLLTTSDSSGNFRITGIQPGSYSLKFSALDTRKG